MTFKQWMAHLVNDRFGTPTALAQALDISVTSLNRGVDNGTFGIETLLRLAEVSDTPPGRVLRLAGKTDLADLIDRLYTLTPESLTPSEQRLVIRWRVITQAARTSLDVILDHLSDAAADPNTVTPPRKKSPRVLRSVQSVGVDYGKKTN